MLRSLIIGMAAALGGFSPLPVHALPPSFDAAPRLSRARPRLKVLKLARSYQAARGIATPGRRSKTRLHASRKARRRTKSRA